MINEETVPCFPELASISPRARNNIALSLISNSAKNIRGKEEAEFEQPGIVKFYGAQHPHVLKDDELREMLIAKGLALDAMQESLGMEMVNAYLSRAFDK